MKHGNAKPSPHVARCLKYPPKRALHSVSIAAAVADAADVADAPATRMHAHTMTCNQPHHNATQKQLPYYASSCKPKQQQYWYRQWHRQANRCPRNLQQAMPRKPATNRTCVNAFAQQQRQRPLETTISIPRSIRALTDSMK
jgi:hypothetical protein